MKSGPEPAPRWPEIRRAAQRDAGPADPVPMDSPALCDTAGEFAAARARGGRRHPSARRASGGGRDAQSRPQHSRRALIPGTAATSRFLGSTPRILPRSPLFTGASVGRALRTSHPARVGFASPAAIRMIRCRGSYPIRSVTHGLPIAPVVPGCPSGRLSLDFGIPEIYPSDALGKLVSDLAK